MKSCYFGNSEVEDDPYRFYINQWVEVQLPSGVMAIGVLEELKAGCFVLRPSVVGDPTTGSEDKRLFLEKEKPTIVTNVGCMLRPVNKGVLESLLARLTD